MPGAKISPLFDSYNALLKNTDTTNFITVTWTDISGAPKSQILLATEHLNVMNIDALADIVIVADTAACLVEVTFSGV